MPKIDIRKNEIVFVSSLRRELVANPKGKMIVVIASQKNKFINTQITLS